MVGHSREFVIIGMYLGFGVAMETYKNQTKNVTLIEQASVAKCNLYMGMLECDHYEYSMPKYIYNTFTSLFLS